MTHLLRSDFYKLRKAKYFRVCLIITIEIVISNYLLDTNMNALLGDLHSDIVLRALIVGICFFAVSFLIGAASFQKRDIK